MEKTAPSDIAEKWDNVGLLVGGKKDVVNRLMVCLDVTSNVVNEACSKNIDLIVTHHPVIFKPLKRILKDDFKGSILYRLIQNNLAVYSAHTNMDITKGGINDYLAELLELTNVRNLNSYRAETLYKLAVFVPVEKIKDVQNAINSKGAGCLGDYRDWSFRVEGTGNFRPLENTKPYIGSPGILEEVREYKLETIVSENVMKQVVDEMIRVHPYEEPAYDIYPLNIDGYEYGLGKTGFLSTECTLSEFAYRVKLALNINNVRLMGDPEKSIQKAAVFCGGFDGSYSGLLSEKPDVLVTGDVKHNEAVDLLEMGFCVIDAGHYSTEIIIVDKLANMLQSEFEDIEVMKSQWEQNPFIII